MPTRTSPPSHVKLTRCLPAFILAMHKVGRAEAHAVGGHERAKGGATAPRPRSCASEGTKAADARVLSHTAENGVRQKLSREAARLVQLMRGYSNHIMAAQSHPGDFGT